jgi:hypothetical protein
MPQSIPKGLTRNHVLKAIADLDAGIEHPFGKPTGYEFVHGEKRYAPKAVVGIAFRHVTGQILKPSEFSGGERNALRSTSICYTTTKRSLHSRDRNVWY